MSEHTLSIRARVQFGVDVLCNSYGGDTGLEWLAKINGSNLDMSSNYSCVIGQITGDFAASPLVTAFGHKQASAWGFYLTGADMDAGLTYSALTLEWKHRIGELQKQRADALLKLEHSGIFDSWLED